MGVNLNDGQRVDTVKEACERLDVSRNTLLRYIAAGIVDTPPQKRVGTLRYRYFPDSWFEANIPKIVAARHSGPALADANEQTDLSTQKQHRIKLSRYLLPKADRMRAELGATVSRLANASQVSRDTAMKVLRGMPTPKTSCERIVLGLQRLGHPGASLDEIVEVALGASSHEATLK